MASFYGKLSICDVISVISDVIKKVQRHHDLIKVTCREIGNVSMESQPQNAELGRL